MINEEQFGEFVRLVYSSIKQNRDNYEEYIEKKDMETANYYLGKCHELEAVIDALKKMEFDNEWIKTE